MGKKRDVFICPSTDVDLAQSFARELPSAHSVESRKGSNACFYTLINIIQNASL
jgi:hypothetical protein